MNRTHAAADPMQYQIADFLIDTARFRISSGGAPIPAEPKVFDLLVYLIEHRDRVVTREELFREVWDGRKVSDATLSNHIKTARKILGDSGEAQNTILTIRSRGYQLIARVTLVQDAHAPYVVVVPFDVSSDAGDAWRPFADQVTREMIRNLRKISGLRVVPAPSAFTFKENKTRDHIRRQLPDVQYVLDGVVSISTGNSLRITVELEDLRKGLVVWDEHFEGRTDDTNLFAVQSSTAAAVSDSLQVAILAEERRSLDEFPTGNLKAYEAYVAGRHQLDLLSHESLPRAIRLFDQAISLDPGFFDAHIARSDAYRQLFMYFEPPIDMFQKVVESIAGAQALRPDSAEAWSSLGLTYVMAWRWKDAWIALNKARRGDPTLAQTELGFALYYSTLGERDRVKSALAAAERLDPLNTVMADWGTLVLLMVGEGQAAREWVDKQIRQHPDVGMVYSSGSAAALVAGDRERAVRLAEHGVKLDRSPLALVLLAQAYGYAGRTAKVIPLLEEAASAGSFVCPYESAVAYLTLNDEERAMTQLDDAVAKRSHCVIFLRVDPRLESIRHTPHYQLLLNRVGLDDVAMASFPR
jgi:DNA-binding winged helix-turn-helix (wHTH) protein/tetratricopeptide (TPR) repeat protein